MPLPWESHEEMTVESDHDILVRLYTMVGGLTKSLESFSRESHEDRRQLHEIKADKQTTDDHEARLRTHDKMLWIGLGGLATIELVVAIIQHVKR